MRGDCCNYLTIEPGACVAYLIYYVRQVQRRLWPSVLNSIELRSSETAFVQHTRTKTLSHVRWADLLHKVPYFLSDLTETFNVLPIGLFN